MNGLSRRFSVAPMIECSLCRRICLFFNLLGDGSSVYIVLFVVPLIFRNARISDTCRHGALVSGI
jgi:hypothetical protein